MFLSWSLGSLIYIFGFPNIWTLFIFARYIDFLIHGISLLKSFGDSTRVLSFYTVSVTSLDLSLNVRRPNNFVAVLRIQCCYKENLLTFRFLHLYSFYTSRCIFIIYVSQMISLQFEFLCRMLHFCNGSDFSGLQIYESYSYSSATLTS